MEYHSSAGMKDVADGELAFADEDETGLFRLPGTSSYPYIKLPIIMPQPQNEKSHKRLDSIDIQILRELQENARLSTKELAARVNLSPTPVFERVKRLEREGIISRYVAVLDAEKLNRSFMVFCSVKMKSLSRDIAAAFAQTMAETPEVTECYNISGQYDYLLKIHAQSMKHYREFVLNVLGTIENLGSLESTFVMDEVKRGAGICL